MITPDQVSTDEDLARRVLVRARSIAPGIDALEGEPRLDAIAILKGVIAEIPAAGSRRVRSRARNGTSVSYNDVGSAFTGDDIAGLRALCGVEPVALPVGSFPTGRPFKDVWPEEVESS